MREIRNGVVVYFEENEAERERCQNFDVVSKHYLILIFYFRTSRAEALNGRGLHILPRPLKVIDLSGECSKILYYKNANEIRDYYDRSFGDYIGTPSLYTRTTEILVEGWSSNLWNHALSFVEKVQPLLLVGPMSYCLCVMGYKSEHVAPTYMFPGMCGSCHT